MSELSCAQPVGAASVAPNGRRSAALCAGVVGAVIIGLLACVVTRCHGNFAYTLDDPYIHLAMSEEIARGGYGVNAGDRVAASSSILWPFLLAPFAAASFHEWVPLIAGAASVIAAAYAMRRVMSDLGFDRSRGTGVLATTISILACVQLGPVTTVFTGMEHGPQVLTVVGIIACMIRVDKGAPAPWWGAAAIGIAPLIRYEMLPAAMAAIVVLALRKQRRTALQIGAPLVGALAIFSAWLASMGLPMLPASILSKSHAADATLDGSLSRLLDQVDFNVFGPAIRSPAGVVMCVTLAALATRRLTARGPDRHGAVATVTAVAVTAHLLLGGWLDDRYVLYALIFAVVGGVAVWSGTLLACFEAASRVRAAVCALLLITSVGATTTAVLTWVPTSATNVWEQHGQVHRFLTQHWRRPVAVVDVGWASYRNEQFVLDLHGLASDRIRRAKAAGRFPQEVAEALREHQISLYVGYEFGRPALPRDWVRVGVIHLAGVRSTVAGESMSFVAARSSSEEVRALLRRFKSEVPPGVRIDIE